MRFTILTNAEVAELVDALDSGFSIYYLQVIQGKLSEVSKSVSCDISPQNSKHSETGLNRGICLGRW
jgi:hypothetical protein